MSEIKTINHTIARAVIWRDDCILLARNIGDEVFFFPGGHVEPGESPADAIKRELKEELGWDRLKFEFVCELPNHWGDSSSCNIESNFIFTVRSSMPNQSEITSQEPHLEFAWVPINLVNSITVLPKNLLLKAIQIRETSFTT